MRKHQALTLPIRVNVKALELGACRLVSETFLYLSGVIHLIARCLIGEVLRYMLIALIDLNPHCKEAISWFSGSLCVLGACPQASSHRAFHLCTLDDAESFNV